MHARSTTAVGCEKLLSMLCACHQKSNAGFQEDALFRLYTHQERMMWKCLEYEKGYGNLELFREAFGAFVDLNQELEVLLPRFHTRVCCLDHQHAVHCSLLSAHSHASQLPHLLCSCFHGEFH